MKAFQRGFGGLQFALSLAVMGVVAVVAVPQYKGFISKAKLTEAYSLAAESRKKVNEFVMTAGRFPKSAGELDAVKTGTVSPPEHVQGMVVERADRGDGVIIKVFLKDGVVENLTGEEQYIYVVGSSPADAAYATEWKCGGSGIDVSLLPESCKT